jgi:hypothetical protein
MRKIIKLTESDLTRIVRRVIREEEEDDDDDGGYYTFDFGGPKDSTALISDIVELIENSEDVNDFKMKIKQYTKNNQEDFNKLSDDERDDIDRFINSIITRHDFPSLLNIEEEVMMGDMYTDFGRKKIPTKSREDISYDIQSVDCGGKNGMDGHVDIDEDDKIIIRYCEGDNEELDYLKNKGKLLLYSKYGR